jgi:hypothetical protein
VQTGSAPQSCIAVAVGAGVTEAVALGAGVAVADGTGVKVGNCAVTEGGMVGVGSGARSVQEPNKTAIINKRKKRYFIR